MRLPLKATVLIATGLAATATAAVSASPARADAPCWQTGYEVTPPNWSDPSEVYFCHNVAPATGYTGVGYSTGPVGTLETTTSWFVCMNDYGDPNGEGSPNPTRWIWTEMDYPHGVWGWIPDKQITSDTDPIPDCFD